MEHKIIGTSMVKIRMFDRNVKTLGYVRHVPQLQRNLISLVLLDSARGGIIKVTKSTLVVMKGDKNFKNLYKLISDTIKGVPHGWVHKRAKGRKELLRWNRH